MESALSYPHRLPGEELPYPGGSRLSGRPGPWGIAFADTLGTFRTPPGAARPVFPTSLLQMANGARDRTVSCIRFYRCLRLPDHRIRVYTDGVAQLSGYSSVC